MSEVVIKVVDPLLYRCAAHLERADQDGWSDAWEALAVDGEDTYALRSRLFLSIIDHLEAIHLDSSASGKQTPELPADQSQLLHPPPNDLQWSDKHLLTSPLLCLAGASIHVSGGSGTQIFSSTSEIARAVDVVAGTITGATDSLQAKKTKRSVLQDLLHVWADKNFYRIHAGTVDYWQGRFRIDWSEEGSPWISPTIILEFASHSIDVYPDGGEEAIFVSWMHHLMQHHLSLAIILGADVTCGRLLPRLPSWFDEGGEQLEVVRELIGVVGHFTKAEGLSGGRWWKLGGLAVASRTPILEI